MVGHGRPDDQADSVKATLHAAIQLLWHSARVRLGSLPIGDKLHLLEEQIAATTMGT